MSEPNSTRRGEDQRHLCDPVCGTQLTHDGALASVEHGGATYYFAHIKCKVLFEKDPEHYTNPSHTPREPTPTEDTSCAEPAGRGAESHRRPRALFGVIAAGGGIALAVAAFALYQEPSPTTGDESAAAAHSSLPADEAHQGTPGTHQAAADSRGKPVRDGAKINSSDHATEAGPPEDARNANGLHTGSGTEEANGSAAPSTHALAMRHYDRGEEHLVAGRVSEAIEALKKSIETSARLAESHALLGAAYRQSGHNRMAAQEIMAYVRLQPSAESIARVRSVLDRAAKTLAAKSPQGGTAKKKSVHIPTGSTPEGEYARANASMRRGDIQAAIRAYRTAIQLRPTYAPAHGGLALAYHEAGRHAMAADALMYFLRFNNDGVVPHDIQDLLDRTAQ